MLLRRAVAAAEQAADADPTSLAIALNGLGLVCKDLAKYDEARAAYRRALDLFGECDPPNDDWIATIYHNLGGIEHAAGKYEDGEPFARRGLDLRRRIGAEDESVAADMAALAAILDARGNTDEAESLYREALAVFERDGATNAGEIAVNLNGLGALLAKRGRIDEAESLIARAVELKEGVLGARHPDVAVSLNNLGYVYRRRGDLSRAIATYGRAVEIFEAALGSEHPKTVACRANHARCAARSLETKA